MKALCIAHRGKHNVYYENTYNAFLEASKRDFFGIETDIHLTKDGRWITHHNETIISGGKEYPILELTFDEIIKMHLDNSQNDEQAYVCPFEDYLRICKESGKRPIIEIKNDPTVDEVKGMLKIVEDIVGISNSTFICFYPWPIYKINKAMKRKVHIQQLIEKHEELKLWAFDKRFDLDIHYDHITKHDVKKFHRHKLKINIWTVDDRETLEKMEALGVDFITTNVFEQND